MRRFLIRVLLFVLIPVLGLTVLYFISDPYKTLKPFSLQYFDSTNRDYISTELFLMNSRQYDYDSFIFASSRGCGLNTYHWKEYLDDDALPFLFQAWGETLTGIEQKVSFLDERGNRLKNALILIDIPGTFAQKQLPTEALSIKDPAVSQQPKWQYQMILLYDFLQKPTQWTRAIRGLSSHKQPQVGFDTVTNDWEKNRLYYDFDTPPLKDSLNNLSSKKRKEFLRDNAFRTETDIKTSKELITEKHIQQLNRIKDVFNKHDTEYRIIITPGYCYSYPTISPVDLNILYSIFGTEKVFDYSGKNVLTSDYNNYSDPNHFGLYVGYKIIENIYNNKEL